MDILTSIDIALGMIVVYLTFSLGVTAINEGLASMLNSRAGWLRKGIESLLTPPTGADVKVGLDRADAFERSPFISALTRSSYVPEKASLFRPRTWRWRSRPSYISRWTILQGLLDSGPAKGIPLDTLEHIREAANELPDRSPARVAIVDLIGRAEGRLDRFRELVDEWLGDFEDQIRSWYRQKTQLVLVLISAVVVFAANLDTMAIFEQLSVDDKVRAALVESALETERDEANEGSSTRESSANAAGETHEQLRRDLRESGLTLGWSSSAWSELVSEKGPLKLLGLLLSTFAVAMGAPFWFDLLQRVASVRAVGLNLVERTRRRAPAVQASA